MQKTHRRLLLSLLIPILLVCSLIPLALAVSLPFSDGFESGDFSAWTSTSGSPDVVTSPVKEGTYSMRDNASAEYVWATYSAETTVYSRCYFQMNATPNANGAYTMILEMPSILRVYAYRGGSTLYMRIIRYVPATNTTDYTFSWAANTWYCVESKFVDDASAGEYRVYLDGTEIYRDTALNTGAASATRTNFGQVLSNYAVATYTDSCQINTQYIGPIISGQNLTFQCNETILPSSYSLFNHENSFQNYAAIIFWAYGTGNAVHLFNVDGTINLWDSSTKLMALGFQASEILRLWDNATATFQTGAAQWFNFTLGVVLKLLDSATLNKALEFQGTGILRLWDNATMNKAVWIGAFEIFNAVKLYTSSTLTAVSATYNFWFLAFGLAVIMLIASAGMFMLFRRRQD